MPQEILMRNNGVLVTLDGNLVRKTVYGLNSSGGRSMVPPKEMVDREIKALKLLEGIQGIQKFVKRESDDTFYTEYIPGTSLLEFPKKSLNKDYFDELSTIINEYQRKGVYRLSQSRRDFLINPKRNPAIVDFGNVLFNDDSISRIPGVVFLAKMYNSIRLKDLRKQYINRNEFREFLPNR